MKKLFGFILLLAISETLFCQNNNNCCTLEELRKKSVDSVDKIILQYPTEKLDDLSPELKKFPKEILKYKKAKELYIWNYGFTRLPRKIYKLDSLETIFLRGGRLKKFPTTISRLKKLKSIEIWYNKKPIKRIPRSICKIKNLEKLFLRGAGVVRYPNCFNQKHLMKLRSLYISDWQIKVHLKKKKFEKLKKEFPWWWPEM